MNFNDEIDEKKRIDKIEAQREYVLSSYKAAKDKNRDLFLNNDENATSEYIYPNQMEDASNIVDKFYRNQNLRVVSIDSFLQYHEDRKPYSQSNKIGQFSLDINYIEHEKDEVIIPKGLAFISFTQILIEQETNINI